MEGFCIVPFQKMLKCWNTRQVQWKPRNGSISTLCEGLVTPHVNKSTYIISFCIITIVIPRSQVKGIAKTMRVFVFRYPRHCNGRPLPILLGCVFLFVLYRFWALSMDLKGTHGLEEPCLCTVITSVWANPTRIKVLLCPTTWLWAIEFVCGLGLGAVFLKQVSTWQCHKFNIFTFPNAYGPISQRSTWSQNA